MVGSSIKFTISTISEMARILPQKNLVNQYPAKVQELENQYLTWLKHNNPTNKNDVTDSDK